MVPFPSALSAKIAHVASADTPAADLRAHLSLLFGEHTLIFAKLSVAAAGGRKDEYHSYAGQLAASDGAAIKGIAFRAADGDLGRLLLGGRRRTLHLAGTLSVDQWQGRRQASLRVIDAAEPKI